jgi:hypothetical protein
MQILRNACLNRSAVRELLAHYPKTSRAPAPAAPGRPGAVHRAALDEFDFAGRCRRARDARRHGCRRADAAAGGLKSSLCSGTTTTWPPHRVRASVLERCTQPRIF